MSYVRFYDLCPEIALNETRSITVFPQNVYGLPPGNYGMLELYCNDKNCDCRRVFITVMYSETKSEVAVITYGWESKEFYAKWLNLGKDIDLSDMDPDDLEDVDDIHGIHLNMLSRQSEIAPAVMQMVSEQLLSDEDYVDRLKRHYTLFRAKIDAQYRNKKARSKKKKRRR